MARPKLGDTETERMQLKITTAEIEAIDDWRYANRVPSRSEAVRRLVQIGIRAHRALPTITKDATDLLNMMSESIDIQDVVAASLKETADPVDYYKAVSRKLWDAVNIAFNRAYDAQDHVHQLLVQITPLTSSPELAEALKLADYRLSAGFPSEDALRSIGASRDEQVKMWKERRQKLIARAKNRAAKR